MTTQPTAFGWLSTCLCKLYRGANCGGILAIERIIVPRCTSQRCKTRIKPTSIRQRHSWTWFNEPIGLSRLSPGDLSMYLEEQKSRIFDDYERALRRPQSSSLILLVHPMQQQAKKAAGVVAVGSSSASTSSSQSGREGTVIAGADATILPKRLSESV
ncbi:hypothetical protein DFQ26_008670 [Actinomortierella ambigua]|nr:hypothetical protein DFQ26_008670 [Actinomortierella ambigua]